MKIESKDKNIKTNKKLFTGIKRMTAHTHSRTRPFNMLELALLAAHRPWTERNLRGRSFVHGDKRWYDYVKSGEWWADQNADGLVLSF